MNRSVLWRLACAGALVFLSACAQTPSSSPDVEAYAATLSGREQVPPNDGPGSGTAQVEFHRRSSLVHWRVTYSGLTGPATGAHIHGPAGPGQNAGIVVPFAVSPSGAQITGQLRITAEQAAQLASGHWYVNLHTARHPGGELRGQLRRRN
jgi:hypothetical protein